LCLQARQALDGGPRGDAIPGEQQLTGQQRPVQLLRGQRDGG
jgi:hypothetical protein